MLFTHLPSSALGSTDTPGPLKLQRASCEPIPGGPRSIEPKAYVRESPKILPCMAIYMAL